MALMKPGVLGTTSGALGSLVFVPKHGTITISQPKRHTVRTSKIALIAQAELAHYSRVWNSSSMDPYRSAWKVWSENNPTRDRFGSLRYRTPKQAYLHFIPQMKVMGLNESAPPTNEEPVRFHSVTIDFNTVTGLSLTLSDPIGILNLILVLYFSRYAGPNLSSKRPSWISPATPAQIANEFSFGPPCAQIGHIPELGEIWRIKLVMSRSTGKPSQTIDMLTPACT
jgi:hypothetical protein